MCIDKSGFFKKFPLLYIQIFAPLYFLFFSSLRCYIETEYFSRIKFFSYYTLLHHTFWNGTVVLSVILVVHLSLRVPVSKLLWMMYGITLMAIPLFYSVLTGEKLRLDYLKGSSVDILTHTLTFCLTYKRNNPLTLELILIFVTILFISYAFTHSWLRAFFTAIAVHITGNFLAIEWFGVGYGKKSIFVFDSQFSNHPFLAVIYLHTMSISVILLLWRSGTFSQAKKSWLFSASVALLGWLDYVLITYLKGFFIYPFDIIMTGLPVATGFFILGLILYGNWKSVSLYVRVILIFMFILQMAVMVPIYLHKEELFTPLR